MDTKQRRKIVDQNLDDLLTICKAQIAGMKNGTIPVSAPLFREVSQYMKQATLQVEREENEASPRQTMDDLAAGLPDDLKQPMRKQF